MRSLVSFALVLIAATPWGCSADTNGVPSSSTDADAVTDAAAETTFPSTDSSSPAAEESAVYASTQTPLHVFDADTTAFAKVGDFDCKVAPTLGASQQGMADIAANATGDLFGVGMLDYAKGTWAIVAIDAKTAHCTVIKALSSGVTTPTTLTFLPKNVLGPDEVLVGVELDGTYVRYDLATAQRTVLGSIPFAWCKASDIVSVEGGETYVTGCAGPTPHIHAIDPKTGADLRDIGSLASSELAGGLGFWAGTIYAFLSPFWGAAVTTTAPLAPPK
ncbi:hypothetical protein BH09MYX1_BH09MYX1_30810 [soil metagenome]